MLVTNIDWDVDEDVYEDGYSEDDLGLPTEVEVPDDVDPDDVADWLSDEYGFCINSFQILDEE